MTCQNVFDAALRTVGETGTGVQIADYTARAPYLLATFVRLSFRVDAEYRQAEGEDPAQIPDTISIPLTDDFPLSDVFIPAAVSYLGALLIADENETLSDKLYREYVDTMTRIRKEIRAAAHPIVDRYGTLTPDAVTGR